MRITGWKVVDDWLGRTPADRHHLVYNALFAISEGTWASRYPHWEDYARKAMVLGLNDDEVLIWRQVLEYPDWFMVLYVGKIDY